MRLLANGESLAPFDCFWDSVGLHVNARVRAKVDGSEVKDASFNVVSAFVE
jgi:hypothetical protein